MTITQAPDRRASKSRKDLERAVIRFAGDSGDGMQVTGEQFTTESAWAGNDISTLPNFPAEIRAPAGTLFGVFTPSSPRSRRRCRILEFQRTTSCSSPGSAARAASRIT